MEGKKFLLHGGLVKSEWDGEIHLIRPEKLAKLYGVNLDDCITIRKRDRRREFSDEMFDLFPRSDGNYDLYDAIARNLVGREVDDDYEYYYESDDKFLKDLPHARMKLVKLEVEDGVIVKARSFDTSNPDDVYGEVHEVEN